VIDKKYWSMNKKWGFYDHGFAHTGVGYDRLWDINWLEVLRGLGRFAPATAANWSEVLRGMRKFIEDWVASLQLRPRIGQKF
jgi:hypothetical protein